MAKKRPEDGIPTRETDPSAAPEPPKKRRGPTRAALDAPAVSTSAAAANTSPPGASAQGAWQAQLAHADKLATLGQVAAGVIHELHNPITSITLHAEYLRRALRDRAVTEADFEKLDRIIASAERMLRQTRALAHYARPSPDSPTRVDLAGAIQQSLLFCEHLVSEGNRQVALDLPSNLPAVRASEGQLEQVFVNLITNACHALPKDSGHLSIAAVRDGAEVVVTIDDDGHGIDSAIRAQIFEPFVTTKATGEGTGLGLSIVRSILETHGGSIALRDTQAGARFEVRLAASESRV